MAGVQLTFGHMREDVLHVKRKRARAIRGEIYDIDASLRAHKNKVECEKKRASLITELNQIDKDVHDLLSEENFTTKKLAGVSST